MSRNEIDKVTSERKLAILRELPAAEKNAVSGATICKALGLTPPQFRRCVDALWAELKVKYSGETRARVYWRTCPKPAAPKKAKG